MEFHYLRNDPAGRTTFLSVHNRTDEPRVARIQYFDAASNLQTEEDVELGPYPADDGTTALLNLGGDVYSIDVERGTRQKLADSARFPIFTPDDRFATFRQSPRAATPAGGIVKTPAGVDGSPESLVEDKDAVLSVQSNLRTARSTVPASWNPRTGRFSPDGNWLAYVSDETGEYQVYVVPYPGPGPKPAVSIDGGLSPIWSPDGSELFEGPTLSTSRDTNAGT